MIPRYLLIFGDCRAALPRLLGRFASDPDLEVAMSSERITVLVNEACPCIKVGDSSCVIGTLFHRRGAARQLSSLGAEDAAQIVTSRGQSLLRSIWGGYVAVIDSSNSISVLRDPSGALPCYFATQSRLTLFASDAELLVQTGLIRADIDFEEIGRQLYRAGVPVPQTGLEPIRELLPGFAVVHASAGPTKQALCWSPWDHVTAVPESTEQSAERLRRIVQHSIASWGSVHERSVLSVSGGLDSSIVAASLAAASTDTVCLTMFTDDPGGDERTYARALCAYLRLPLIERPYRLEDVDISVPLGCRFPRPRDRAQALAYERTHLEIADQVGAASFTTGNGGDSVFAYSQSAAPVADRFMRAGLGRGSFRSLLDVCRQTGCSMPDAALSAWRLAHGSPAYVTRPNPLFLDPDFIAAVDEAELQHPWLDAPAGALPGKAAHIGWILRIQHCLEASRGGRLPVINPLMSQPILEACLAIPSWEWRLGGQDRALARLAFARDLPALVLNRRVKGSPSHFAARLLDHFRSAIRERLVGGQLACKRIIDRVAIDRALAGERAVPDLERVRILELVNVEAWLDYWTSRRQAPEPAKADITGRPDDEPRSQACPIP